MHHAVSSGHPVWESMHDESVLSGLPKPAQSGVDRLKRLVLGLRERINTYDSSLADAVRELIQKLDYMSVLERQYPTPEEVQARQASVEELVNAVAEYEAQAAEPSIAGFLEDVALGGNEFSDSKDKSQKQNAVSLMTYHSSKGLEFPIVYMVGMEEGILPHRRSLVSDGDDVEEERRLCYVGVTRAQDELTLSLPLQRKKWGKPRDTFASRFLYELTGQADNPNRIRAMQGARKEILRSS